MSPSSFSVSMCCHDDKISRLSNQSEKKQKKECSKQSSVTKGTREGGLKLVPIFMVQIPGEKWGLQIKERGSHELHSHISISIPTIY